MSTTVNLLRWALIGALDGQQKTRRKRVQTRALAAFGAAFFDAPDSVDASRYCEILDGASRLLVIHYDRVRTPSCVALPWLNSIPRPADGPIC